LLLLQDQVLQYLQSVAAARAQQKWGAESVKAILQLVKGLPFFTDDVRDLLPSNESQLDSMLAAAGVKGPYVHTYVICTNPECGAVFRCEMKDATKCHHCGAARNSQHTARYISIIDHLEWLYSCPALAPLMTWHASRQAPLPGHLHDVQDTLLWDRRVRQDSIMAADSRSAVFGIAADGIKVDANNSSSAELWPLVTCLYNLPPDLRWVPGIALVSCLLPAGYSNLSGVLGILTDEVKYLYHSGHMITDASSGQQFDCRATVLRCKADTRGFPHLDQTPQAPALQDACNRCKAEGTTLPSKAYCDAQSEQ
jgi:hypothetical protein